MRGDTRDKEIGELREALRFLLDDMPKKYLEEMYPPDLKRLEDIAFPERELRVEAAT